MVSRHQASVWIIVESPCGILNLATWVGGFLRVNVFRDLLTPGYLADSAQV